MPPSTAASDHLLGLKENVIIGKLIPASTGARSRKAAAAKAQELSPEEAEALREREAAAAFLASEEGGRRRRRWRRGDRSRSGRRRRLPEAAVERQADERGLSWGGRGGLNGGVRPGNRQGPDTAIRSRLIQFDLVPAPIAGFEIVPLAGTLVYAASATDQPSTVSPQCGSPWLIDDARSATANEVMPNLPDDQASWSTRAASQPERR